MKLCVFMEDSGSAWSGLGLSMALPSAMKEELAQLKIELRDMKLQVARDLMGLQESLSSIASELSAVMDKHKSLLTRIEGLEVRAQGIGHPSSIKDEFNAFAFVALDELEGSDDSNSQSLVEDAIIEIKEVQPDGSLESGEEELSDEDIAAEYLSKFYDYMAENKSVMNNLMYSLVLGNNPKYNKVVKKIIKETILSDENILVHKVDKFRSLYYLEGEDPERLLSDD